MGKPPFISFPEGYLGARPAKFTLLANSETLFAINKPAGIACFQHDWTLGKPDFSMALRRELLNEKPQLKDLGVSGVFRIYNLDAELSGALVYAKTEESEIALRNAFGSRQLRFSYHLLCKVDGESRERFCDLPLARHFNEKRTIVSHKTGKKCDTSFTYLRNFGGYELWEANTRDHRPHQIRVHAAECGISIVGELDYLDGGEICLSQLKRDFRPSRKRREGPIYPPIALHLVRIEFELPEQAIPRVDAPLPSGFANLLKRLDANRAMR